MLEQLRADRDASAVSRLLDTTPDETETAPPGRMTARDQAARATVANHLARAT